MYWTLDKFAWFFFYVCYEHKHIFILLRVFNSFSGVAADIVIVACPYFCFVTISETQREGERKEEEEERKKA